MRLKTHSGKLILVHDPHICICTSMPKVQSDIIEVHNSNYTEYTHTHLWWPGWGVKEVPEAENSFVISL